MISGRENSKRGREIERERKRDQWTLEPNRNKKRNFILIGKIFRQMRRIGFARRAIEQHEQTIKSSSRAHNAIGCEK